MCLGIPALVVGTPGGAEQEAWVEVGGARRRVSTALLEQEVLQAGDWVLVHVGFALAKLDEEEARATLRDLEQLEVTYTDELTAMAASPFAGGTSGPAPTAAPAEARPGAGGPADAGRT